MGTMTYQSTALVGTNLKGAVKADPDGYYELVVGAFDTKNSAGDWYDFHSAKAHFDGASDFVRRVQSGALYGEAGHPVMTPGMSKNDWILRILTIDPKNISHHIKDLTLDDTRFKNPDGTPMVAVYARIKPMIEKLALSLENPHDNTAFSIRCLTMNHFDPARGCTTRSLSKPVTYDWVPEPGIAIATKYNAPGLEALSLTGISPADIENALAYARERYLAGSMESAEIITSLEQLRHEPPRVKGLIMPTARRGGSSSWR